jgi:hypothetical protein
MDCAHSHYFHQTRITDPYFDLDRLDELTYADLKHAIDPNDLPYTDYAPLIKYVRFLGVEGNILSFFVPSPTKINRWTTFVQFIEWDEQVRDLTLNAVEAARLLLWSGNIRVHCPCPAFAFWGHAFVATELGMAIHPETRYPHIRNPTLLGVCCKHLRRTTLVLGAHLADMASAIKKQREALRRSPATA